MIGWPRDPEHHLELRKFLLGRGAAAVTEQAHILFWHLGDGKPVWCVAYDQWCGKTCSLSWASNGARFLPKGFRHAGFFYPFKVLKLMRVFGQVNSNNTAALRLDLWLGFREVYRAQGCHNEGGDLVYLEMRAEECKWIRT